jgi:hypothetical protein
MLLQLSLTFCHTASLLSVSPAVLNLLPPPPLLLLLLLLLPQAMAEVAKQGLYPNPLVTELVPLGSGADRFWAGEDYHQNYYNDNPGQGYCSAVVAPKVAKFRWAAG